MKRGKYKIISFVLMFFLGISSAYSWTISYSLRNDGSNQSQNNYNKHSSLTSNGWGEVIDGYEYSCSYDYYTYANSSLDVYIVDQFGNDLIVSNDVMVNAGMYVGMSLLERYQAGYGLKVNYSYKAVNNATTCTVVCHYCLLDVGTGHCVDKTISHEKIDKKNIKGYCSSITPPTNYQKKTPLQTERNCTSGSIGVYDSTKEKECKDEALRIVKAEAEKLSKTNLSSKVELPDSNDINSDGKVSIGTNRTLSCKFDIISYSGNVASDSCSYSVPLSPGNVCMNMKTGEVKYGDICSDINNDLYEIIPNVSVKKGNSNINYFHYFLPLNMKNNDLIEIPVVAGKKISAKECIDWIENRNKYGENYAKEVILDNNNINLLTGNLENDKRIINRCTSDGKRQCCHLGFNINIENKFYKEENGKISGFNYYYRPISISNPFPNGISDNSLWTDVFNGNDDYRIKFGSKTYESSPYLIENVSNIADSYFSWNSMNLSGRSSRISGSGNEVIASRTGASEVFNLGNGPLISTENGEVCATKKAREKGMISLKPCINN